MTWPLLIGIGWIAILLVAALLRAKWLVDPPKWTLYVLYFPALLRESLSAERTRAWIIGLLVVALVALVGASAFGNPA